MPEPIGPTTMDWRNTFQQHKQLLLVLSGGVVLLLIAVVLLQRLFIGKTYVRIVDTTTVERQDTDAPGADINAFEIRTADGTSTYASVVVSSRLGDAGEGLTNAHTATETVLGSPEKETPAQYLSLGHSGEVIVKIPRRLRGGNSLIVYEIGQSTGPRAETYDIYTSSSPDGHWQLLGSGAGIEGIVQPQS